MREWRYIEEDRVSAAYGLATDEFLMNLFSEDKFPEEAILKLYTYDNYSVLVGRFQNIHAEIDLTACDKLNYQFGRRLTGGGAIIMGEGQLGICLATANTFQTENTKELYALFSSPILNALEELGIQAELVGKNDIEVNGKKIAGLGIHVNPHGGIQFHTSLLVDLDIPIMLKVLRIPLQKIGDKAQIHKVEERITTVSRELGRKVSMDEIRKIIRHYYEVKFHIGLKQSNISDSEKKAIDIIADKKYLNEEWIYQKSPQPDMTGMGLKKTSEGLLRTYVALKGEAIKSVLITGDFSGHEQLFHQIETTLKWSPLDKLKVEKAVNEAYSLFGQIGNIDPGDIVEAIWRAALGAMKEVQYTYSGSCYFPKLKEEKVIENRSEKELSNLEKE